MGNVAITPMSTNVWRDKKCHHPAHKMSSPGAQNVITRRTKCHHPACPGDPEEKARDIWICMTGVNLDCPNESGNDTIEAPPQTDEG
jgi:hypothetical protein